MKKIDYVWDEKLNKSLFRILKKRNENAIKKSKEKSKKYIDKITNQITKENKEKEKNKILDTFEKEVRQVFSLEKKYIKSEKHKKLTEIEKNKKIKSKLKLAVRSMQGNMFSNFLKYIVIGKTDYYIWCTMQDDRVRESHNELEGKLLRFSTSKILPQEEINCRCSASVVLPKNLKEIEKLNKQAIKSKVKHKNDYEK